MINNNDNRIETPKINILDPGAMVSINRITTTIPSNMNATSKLYQRYHGYNLTTSSLHCQRGELQHSQTKFSRIKRAPQTFQREKIQHSQKRGPQSSQMKFFLQYSQRKFLRIDREPQYSQRNLSSNIQKLSQRNYNKIELPN